MFLFNGDSHRAKQPIFQQPIYESITMSSYLQTNGKIRNSVKVPFSQDTPVGESLQESNFQKPENGQKLYQNTPNFNKVCRSNQRKEMKDYLEDSNQLRIDEAQSDYQQSSNRSKNSQKSNQIQLDENSIQIEVREDYKELQVKASQEPNNKKKKPFSIQSSQEFLQGSTDIKRVEQNIFSQLNKSDLSQQQQEQSSIKNDNINEVFEQLQEPELQQSVMESNDQLNQSKQELLPIIDQLIQGFIVIKYCRKSLFGQKKRLLQVTPDLKLIVLRNIDHKIKAIYSINKIKKIESGNSTETFRHYKLKPEKACFCFSIFLEERTIDLQTQTMEELNLAISSLTNLIQ